MLESKSFYTKLEQFYNSFSWLESSEPKTIINTLADNIFKYQIILSDETVLPIITPVFYNFNSSTNSWYNKTEFKRLLIDLGVLTRSMGGISQLKVLQ